MRCASELDDARATAGAAQIDATASATSAREMRFVFIVAPT
jgi:hypothetical protein